MPEHPLLRAVAGLILLVVLGCGHGPGNHTTEKPEEPPLASRVFTVKPIEWPVLVRVQGNLHADETATISSRVAGLVLQVHVDRGQAVKANDLLVSMRTADFDLKVAQAQSQLSQVRSRLGLRAEQKDSELDPLKSPPVREAQAVVNEAITRYDRARSLRGAAATPEEEVQMLRATVEVSQARLQSAMNQVREMMASLPLHRAELALAEQARTDAEVRAPFAGVIEQKLIAPGAYVQPGVPLLTLVRTDPLRFTAGVPERRTLAVSVGQPVQVQVEGRKQPLQGKVSRLSPALTTASRSLTIEVDVPNPGNSIPANFFAEADILVDPAAQTLAIPLTALSEFAGIEKVWVVQDGKAAEQRVRTGRRDFQNVEILSGLKADDTILLDARLGRAGKVLVQK